LDDPFGAGARRTEQPIDEWEKQAIEIAELEEL
jgi:hypothetical protein